MSAFQNRLEAYLHSSSHLSKRHVHPRLMKMFEVGGMTAVFERAQGQYAWDMNGQRYLDLLAGGGVYFAGRNHPKVHEYLRDVLSMELPNLSIVNASVLGGVLAEKLLEKAGPHFGKVIFANTGTETTEVCVRFARYVTRRRRFLYLEGSFHGRTYAAISMCGFPALREGQEPLMPIVTPIRRNDIKQLRRELKMGDVAGFIYEPVQGMTCEVADTEFIREAEILCEENGTLLIADEVQTGLGRTGAWFATTAMGVRPSMMTVSKTLSGGHVPVGAVMISDAIYAKVYEKFKSGPFYFSTFAENNLAMAAGIATLEILEEMDAPNEAARQGERFRVGLERIASKYDCIDRIVGKGLMICVYFKDSSNLKMLAEQKLLNLTDASAFAAAVNVDLYTKHHILVQIPGPGLNAIKILPPVCCTDEDIDYFLDSFEHVLAEYYEHQGPAVRLGRQVVGVALDQVRQVVPTQYLPPALAKLLAPTGPMTFEDASDPHENGLPSK